MNPKILFGPRKFLVKKLWALIKFRVWKKFCPRTFWFTKMMTPKKLGHKSFVKIGPVTTELLLSQNFWGPKCSWTKLFPDPTVFRPEHLLDPKKESRIEIFFGPNIFQT